MRKLALCTIFLVLCSLPSFAQSRGEAGVFLDYVNVAQTGTNNFGIGGRFAYGLLPYLQAEGEVAYDYGISFDEALRNVQTGSITAVERTDVGITHGLFGVKLQHVGSGIHPFATAKVGFMDFRLSPSLLPFSDVISPIFGIRTSQLNAAMYFGGGVTASIKWVGLRLDAGDEIYFNHGANNNLRIAFGPVVRF